MSSLHEKLANFNWDFVIEPTSSSYMLLEMWVHHPTDNWSQLVCAMCMCVQHISLKMLRKQHKPKHESWRPIGLFSTRSNHEICGRHNSTVINWYMWTPWTLTDLYNSVCQVFLHPSLHSVSSCVCTENYSIYINCANGQTCARFSFCVAFSPKSWKFSMVQPHRQQIALKIGQKTSNDNALGSPILV